MAPLSSGESADGVNFLHDGRGGAGPVTTSVLNTLKSAILQGGGICYSVQFLTGAGGARAGGPGDVVGAQHAQARHHHCRHLHRPRRGAAGFSVVFGRGVRKQLPVCPHLNNITSVVIVPSRRRRRQGVSFADAARGGGAGDGAQRHDRVRRRHRRHPLLLPRRGPAAAPPRPTPRPLVPHCAPPPPLRVRPPPPLDCRPPLPPPPCAHRSRRARPGSVVAARWRPAR